MTTYAKGGEESGPARTAPAVLRPPTVVAQLGGVRSRTMDMLFVTKPSLV
jgi:hypothetical protein